MRNNIKIKQRFQTPNIDIFHAMLYSVPVKNY